MRAVIVGVREPWAINCQADGGFHQIVVMKLGVSV